MERRTLHRLLWLVVLTLAFAGLNPSPAVAGGPRVEPFNAQPAGQTYGRWAAEWWQWALASRRP